MTERGAIRVLHVDDDPDFLEVVSTYLENAEASLSIVTEDSAQAGLALLEETRIDCVVSDYKMPGLDGLAFLEAVRDDHPEMPFILYTGHGSEEIASEAISAGVTEYMQKETGTDQYTVLANTIVNAVEHARAEDALRESEERYRTVVEQSHDGIYIYRGRQFEFLNDRICEITGHDKETLYEMDIFELIHPEDRERVAEIAERRRAGEDAPNRYQARIVTDSGETRYLEFSVESITYEGAYAGMGSVRDVTERRRREERLDEFASIVAHDLRNPLNVLAGRLDLARETGEDTHFDAMERSVETMETLLEDMRDLARLGMPVQETGVVDVGEVAQRAWSIADGTGDATLELAADLPTIEADADRLERLLVECFENAIVHGGPDVAVRVESTTDGFAIADDGPGLDEPDRVFEAGYTTETGRTGFGLAIVEWVADAHGWHVEAAESTDGGVRIVLSDIEHM